MILIDGPEIVEFLRCNQITHLVWIPDSTMGVWHESLTSAEPVKIVRPTREGEAIAIAAGLWLGGARPVVALQCTGFFEAGDAIRNCVYDLRVPLFLIVGYRGYFARQRGSKDSAPVFAEPILQAWQLSYTLVDTREQAAAIADVYTRSQARNEAHALLLAE